MPWMPVIRSCGRACTTISACTHDGDAEQRQTSATQIATRQARRHAAGAARGGGAAAVLRQSSAHAASPM